MMKIYHITRHHLRWMGAVVVLMLLAVPVLAGCFNGRSGSEAEAILLPGTGEQTSFLTSLGWQVDPDPIETLDLRLPAQWDEEWAAYAQLQTEQGLPFSDFADATVRRVTYAVTNYPHIPDGVQANLYLCGHQLIGGDIIFTGQGGFRAGLQYPEG